ncbi:MAG TPA: DUF92 domain-containing protein, partial [Flavisolibacter sp.]|nr:DUF92 domain-containing protein [Flavisolibacter sp.]
MTSFGALALMFIAALASYLGKRLTAKGAIVGWLIGCFLFLGCGWAAVLSMALFFGLAVAATATGRREKEQEGIAEQNKGRRSAYQVFANGGLAGILGFWAWIWPLSEAYCLMFCASAFAS